MKLNRKHFKFLQSMSLEQQDMMLSIRLELRVVEVLRDSLVILRKCLNMKVDH